MTGVSAGGDRDRRQRRALRSGNKKGGIACIYRVPIFAANERLTFGQGKVAEKSNAIMAIPKLLEVLAIEEAIETIDAMGYCR